MRYGLDGLRVNPSFEEFNKPTLVNQPFKWDDKLYLMPVWSRSDMDELYSNPQLVQAPDINQSLITKLYENKNNIVDGRPGATGCLQRIKI